MNNIMTINNYKAVITYDPETELFRGEFKGLNGGADFYGADISTLKAEGEASLQVFLDMCKEHGINPHKNYSGRFNIRISPKLHEDAILAAAAKGISLNELVIQGIAQVSQTK
ncbi:type II toxin-antitoxin system HicB family antitoxin [Neisseriaceae bacterium ESL0693]|nr:type II toxin-antitoxin system HicB family antitoxin [Neisseriaceae bacterium ESL0693]